LKRFKCSNGSRLHPGMVAHRPPPASRFTHVSGSDAWRAPLGRPFIRQGHRF
jgi:hypothetical protein